MHYPLLSQKVKWYVWTFKGNEFTPWAQYCCRGLEGNLLPKANISTIVIKIV